nr:MAG TPA: hypothetical protein [Caudoviricetes sp.]
MTQKEIVTALRCCAEGECHGCTIHNDKQRCQERVLDAAADLIEAQQTKIDQLTADLMASVAGKLGGAFTPAEAFKLIEYYKGEKCIMCKHFGGVKGKHLTEKLPEDHGKNCWYGNCNFEWVPPEKRVE